MRWMLDADICIALIKRQPPKLAGRIQAKRWGRVRISSVAVAELEFGIAKSEQCLENSERLRQFLLPFDVDAFDREAASVYGAVRLLPMGMTWRQHLQEVTGFDLNVRIARGLSKRQTRKSSE
jgi:predicted nucleic acid-binding protein